MVSSFFVVIEYVYSFSKQTPFLCNSQYWIQTLQAHNKLRLDLRYRIWICMLELLLAQNKLMFMYVSLTCELSVLNAELKTNFSFFNQ